MPRRLLVLAGVVALAVSATACNSPVAPFALKVNGETLSRSDFDDELQAVVSNENAQSAAQKLLNIAASPGSLGSSTDNTDPASVSADFARGWLTLRAQAELIHQEATSRNLTVDAATRASVDQSLEAAFAQTANGAPATTNPFRSLPKATQDWLVTFLAERGLLAPAPTEADAQAAYEKDPTKYPGVCFSHILVADEAKATELKAQLDAGADFASLASANSTDPGSAAQGGALNGPTGPCWTVDEIGAELLPRFPDFANAILLATPKVVAGPVQSAAGWHLVLVTSTNTFEAGQSAVMVDLQQQVNAALSARLETLAKEGNVEVGTWYGRWDPTKLVVVPIQTLDSPAATTDTTTPVSQP